MPAVEDTGSLRTLTLDDDQLIKIASTILHEINLRGELAGKRQSKDDIVSGTKLPFARVNALMNMESQKAVHFPLSEIRDVLAYARSYARSITDLDLQRSIFDRCARLCLGIQEFLGDDSADALERALVAHMDIDSSVQDRFSARHQGTHVLIRFDRSGNIVLSRMDVLPKRPGPSVCRFITRRLGPKTAVASERVVDGFIYQYDERIYSVGRVVGTNAVRSVIALPLPQQTTDMIGLRLGLSALDDGPFAHRIYCRRIGPLPESVDHDPYTDWDPLFRSTTFNGQTSDRISKKITDIHEIVALLKEPEDKALSWGLRIPRGTSDADHLAE